MLGLEAREARLGRLPGSLRSALLLFPSRPSFFLAPPSDSPPWRWWRPRSVFRSHSTLSPLVMLPRSYLHRKLSLNLLPENLSFICHHLLGVSNHAHHRLKLNVGGTSISLHNRALWSFPSIPTICMTLALPPPACASLPAASLFRAGPSFSRSALYR